MITRDTEQLVNHTVHHQEWHPVDKSYYCSLIITWDGGKYDRFHLSSSFDRCHFCHHHQDRYNFCHHHQDRFHLCHPVFHFSHPHHHHHLIIIIIVIMTDITSFIFIIITPSDYKTNANGQHKMFLQHSLPTFARLVVVMTYHTVVITKSGVTKSSVALIFSSLY